MRIEYDAQANALYVRLREGPIARTREVAVGTMVDLDAQRRPLGIEILGAREQLGGDPLAVDLRLVAPRPAVGADLDEPVAAE
jgi:uncharacterized protein YuzE